MARKGEYRRGSANNRVKINKMGTDWPRHYCVHELFEAQVLRTPDAVALVSGERQLSYRELNARANQLAHELQKMTNGMDVPIGICVERSVEMAVGILAILKAGAAYLPLDPAYPQEVLCYMLERALVPVVLTQRSVASCVPETRAAQVFVELSGRGSEENPRRRISPGNLACVIYSSGSTGLPRAVAMPHRPLVNRLAWQSGTPAFAQPARTVQFASLSFELSFQEMFSTWCNGGTLVLISEEIRHDPLRFLEFLNEQRIERVFLPFPALKELAEAAVYTGIIPRYLRDVTSTGEQLRICPAIVGFFERLGNCRLHNHYSLSETHVATVHTLYGPPRRWPVLPPVGFPIANVKVYLLDGDLQPVPTGVPGEIFIGGECLAQGYLYRPALTAERFIADPFCNERNMRIYRTGDIGRRLPDGSLEFLGRAECQVDIQGARVEPSAVDAFLSQHPSVRACVTVAVGGGRTDRRLCSYVVPRDTQPTKDDLREFLQTSLPKYMIPSLFGFLDALPLTPNGKVDRHRLPVPGTGPKRIRTPQSYEMAISHLETDSPCDRRSHLGGIARQRGRGL